MAMKKDDDKSKRTLSGKKPATFGGANSKLIKPKPTASTQSGPRAVPSRPMGRDVTGEANFDKTPRTRATLSVGPATMSMGGGKTAKSKGGMNMTGGKVAPKKSVNAMAKMSSSTTYSVSSPADIQAALDAMKKKNNKWNKQNTIAAAALGTVGLGATLSSDKVRGKIKQAAKYIADTKNRKARKRAQEAENEAMIVERKAKQEAKNPSTIIGKNSKISKSTMKKLKAR